MIARGEKSFLRALQPYRDSRMAKILLLGFISGFPWLLIGSMLSLWLKEEGVSRSAIGLFGLAFTVYAFNFLWAPIVDGVRIPFLSHKFGNRRAWILAMQFVIATAMLVLAAAESAAQSPLHIALCIFIIACASATQDVAIDALRISLIRKDEPEKVGPGAAMATIGWWLGFGGGKAIVLPLIMAMQDSGIANAWQAGYFLLCAAVAISAFLLARFVREEPEKNANVHAAIDARTIAKKAAELYARPVTGFVSQYTMRLSLLLIAFVFFFKIGEAFLGRMSVVFYKEAGFSLSEIALVSGGLGTIAFCVFALLGSGINARFGLFRGIIIGGVAMASTNLLFALLALYPERWLFAFAAVADQFTTAVSTVAFVAFLSQLCARQYAATQYAALASLGNLSRTTLAAGSGFLIDGLGGDWPLFFVLTTLMVLPSLFILILNRKSLEPIMRGESN